MSICVLSKSAVGYAYTLLYKGVERGREMPQVRKLAPDEVQAFQNKGKGQRKLVEEQYDAILSDYEVGDYGEAILEPDDNRLTVRNRLKAAASRRSVGIDFRRTSGELLRFKIVEQSDSSPAPVEPPAAPKRKGGRPKKSA
jgi:hypothetical protein